jgi:hypothetical protein
MKTGHWRTTIDGVGVMIYRRVSARANAANQGWYWCRLDGRSPVQGGPYLTTMDARSSAEHAIRHLTIPT